jgi:hypothetical protein
MPLLSWDGEAPSGRLVVLLPLRVHRPHLARAHDSRFTPGSSHAYTALRSAAMAS